MKRIAYILLIQLLPLALQAQHIRVAAPNSVVVGEEFQISYTVFTDGVQGMKLGKLPAGVECTNGPFSSTQSSIQMRNGHTSSSSSTTYTYLFVATRRGTFIIPPARMTVNGQNLASTPLRITASAGSSVVRSSAGASNYEEEEIKTPSKITSKDLFIKVTANKTRVHEQEPVLLTYKVYTAVNLINLTGKMPDLTGFHVQEVKQPQQNVFHTERVGGRNYRCTTWSQYVMYPQMTGKLQIPSITFHGVIQQDDNAFDPFAFMSDDNPRELRKDIKAEGLTIQVDPLPSKPTDFSGGVGHFNISAQVDKTEVKEGSPITIRVVVSGAGNLKLIKQPTLQIPKDFELYDPKVTDKTRLTANGLEGNMIYDFLVVPHKKGDYTLPSVKFVYYDTATGSYKTIRTQAFKIKVEQGDDVNSGDTENLLVDGDIHDLKLTDNELSSVSPFFNSISYWLVLLLLVSGFSFVVYTFRQRAIARADIAQFRGKNAEKVARRQLMKASELMLKGKAENFYDEILRTLWGYAGNKLNMPIEQLSKENIAESFANKKVDRQRIDKFIGALDECEFERYAPGDEKGNMNRTYEAAMTAILGIEECLGKKAKQNVRLMLCIVIAFLGYAGSVSAVTKADADKAYQQKNYQQAIADYKVLINQAPTAERYYNLGNAYYRVDSITRAIICYERAHKMAPSDDDILFNLRLAESKTIDKISPKDEMFFASWASDANSLLSIDAWAAISITALLLALCGILLFLLADKEALRKLGFFGGITFALFFIFANVMAFQQRSKQRECNEAIVVSPSAPIKSAPDSKAENTGIIHEGTKVKITDKALGDWLGIQLADGRSGWMQPSQIEEI